MPFIEQLLNGENVEWKPLGEVAELKRGKVISKVFMEENKGVYPVYSSQTANNGEIGKIKTYDFNQEAITWTTDGANAGTVFYRKGKFSITNVCGLIKISNDNLLSYKFLYYWLSVTTKEYVNTGMGNPKLMSNQVKRILIPLPPLSVQHKIVEILDKFTALEAELEAELDCRKRQYEYYRNQLLSFDILNKGRQKLNDVKVMTLGEIAKYSSTRIKSSCLCETSFVGVDNLLQDRKGKTISTHVPTEGTFAEYQVGDILIGNIRPYLKKIWYADNSGGASGDVLVIHLTNEQIMSRYLYQVLADDKFFSYNMQHAKGAKMPRGNKQKIMEYKIPLPPLSVQREIVEILDKFDTLCNSISEGLPTEIELRRKQYEYYRNQLLTFAQ